MNAEQKQQLRGMPIVIEKFADNGEHSHWELYNELGEKLWSEETHCLPIQEKSDAIEYDSKLEEAYIAGYKKRAELSGLRYDFLSEIRAKSNFISYVRDKFKSKTK